MRRFTLTIATSFTALVLLPAGALASSHAEHQRRQHDRRHHHVHHASVRHERFGAVTTGASSGNSANSGAGTPTPAENAGTVKSFSAGVLTLALADGSTVSGRISDGTEIECEAADMNNLHADGDGGAAQGGGDNSGPGNGGDQGQRGGDNGDRGDDNGDRGDDNGDRGDDNGNDNQTCMAGDLVAGAAVRSAELRISSAGATWDKIELIG